MKSTQRVKRWGKRLGVACVLSGALMLGACDKSAKDLMLEADGALQAGNLEQAEKSLDEAMKKDAENFQGIILRSQIYSAKKEYEKAEQELTSLWEKRKLDDEKLSTDQKRIRNLLKGQYFPDLYREWGDAIDAKANPQKYEEVIHKGLKYDLKDPRLNTLLVDFYNTRGEALIVEKKKIEAALEFEKIGKLYTTSEIRKKADVRATALRQEVLVDQIAQRFEQDLKPKLVAAELYDAQSKLVMFVAEGQIDRRGTPEEALAASEPLISEQINAATRLIAGVGEDVKLGAPTKTEFYKVVESEFKRGDYKVKASFPEEQLQAYAKFVIERDAQEKKDAEKGDAKKDDEPAEEKNAGGGDDSEPVEGEAPEADGEKAPE